VDAALLAVLAVVLCAPTGCGSNRAPSSHSHVTTPAPTDDHNGGAAVGEPSPDGRWSVYFTRAATATETST
jgi:hypothetical protein